MVDRLIVKPGIEKRLSESLEQVLELAEGLATVDVQRSCLDLAQMQEN